MVERLNAVKGRMREVVDGTQCLKWLVTSTVTARFSEDTRESRVGDAVMNARAHGGLNLWDRAMIRFLSREDRFEAKSQVAGAIWTYNMEKLGEKLKEGGILV